MFPRDQTPAEPEGEGPQTWRDPAREGREREGADLGEMLRIIARHWFAVLLPLVLATSLALAYLVVTRPTYTATASILIDARVKSPVTSDSGPALGFPDAALVESQVKLIASDVVLRRVVVGEKLMEDPEFIIASPGLRDRLLGLIGLGGAAPGGGDPTANALGTLARAVTVKRSERTYVMDVDVAAGDGQKAARIANAISRAYIADQQDARYETSKRDIDFLRVRLESLQARVQDADRKVEDYKTQNRISDANGKLINEQQLLEVTTALGAAHARASEAKAKYDQIQRLANSGKLPDATSDAVKSVTIDKLRGQYAEIARQEANFRATLGARHPAMVEVETQLREVRRLIAEELKRIADTSANEYQTARSAETALERQSDSLKKASSVTNQSLVQLRELQREADAQRSVYEKFLRTRETLTGDNSEQPIARIIAPALPSNVPSAPRRAAILSLAIIGGLALGIANALLAHAWRRGPAPAGRLPRALDALRLSRRNGPAPPAPAAQEPPGVAARTLAHGGGLARPGSAAPTQPPGMAPAAPAAASPPRAGRRSADVPRVIGSMPTLAPARQPGTNWFARHAGGEPVVDALNAAHARPGSAYAEAIHAILAQIRGSLSEGDPQTVLVTARHANIGVSALSANLAFAAAAEGERVLLIEANGAHPVLSTLVQEGGIATPIMLKGVMRLAYRLDAGDEGMLMVVPLEDEPEAGAPDVAVSGRRLDGIKNNFSFVVIDGAVIGDDDATMMASAATDIIIVSGAPECDSESLAGLCADLGVPSQKIYGLVLSRSDAASRAA